MKEASLNYRSDIDGLRAIAVLLVVGFHAFPDWVKGGFIGVDIFFVISGYLISTIIITKIRSNTFSIVDFYYRRVKRIFPALLIVLIFCLVVGWLILLPQEYINLGENVVAGSVFISNLLLWKESGYFDVAAESKPLLHLWSLGIEEQFYIVWPIILWLSILNKIKFFPVLIFIFILSFTLNIYLIKVDSVSTFYLPFTRFWELIGGAILAEIMYINRDKKLHYTYISRTQILWCTLIAILLILVGILLINKQSNFPGWWALIPVVAAILLILPNKQGWINRVLLSNKILVSIGLISFPLYLWHWPLLTFARIIEDGTPTRGVRIFAVILSFLLGWITYRWIERPVRFSKYQKFTALILLLLMMIVGALGYYIYIKKGIPERYKKTYGLYVETIDFKWPEYVRFDKCHIQSHNLNHHQEICHEKNRPLIAIWGDSHASSLYPGIKKLQENYEFGIEQLTTAGCPPILNLKDLRYKKNCNEINETVLKNLKESQPDILILHAAWKHEQYPLTDNELIEKIMKTIEIIQENLPNTRIVILGTTPRWNDSPQKESFRYLRQMTDKEKDVPNMQKALLLRNVDQILNAVANNKNIEFWSILDVMCEKKLCLARLHDGPQDFTAIDSAHLSKSGSEYLISQLKNRMLENLQRY